MSDMTFQQLAGEYFQLFDERHYGPAGVEVPKWVGQLLNL